MTHNEKMICLVVRHEQPPRPDAAWHTSPWAATSALQLDHFMGSRPAHFPRTQVKIGYSDKGLHLLFRVDDQYVRAVATVDQGKVWEDSCVEFFFTPGLEISRGYFNLEMNCGGTLLLHFQPGGRERVILPLEECARIERYHTLPRIVEPEMVDPVVWSVGYTIPLGLLQRYCPVAQPASGVRWRGNFYKCADKSSHPHWLTWASVEFPRPRFHLPDFFGVLQFQ